MKHIRAQIDPETIKKSQRRATSVVLAANVPAGLAVCKAALGPDDSLTDTALAAECDDCRTAAGVANTRDKNWGDKVIGVRAVREYTPEPMENADEIIASKRKNTEGT